MLSFYETLSIAMQQRGLRAADISRKTGIYQSYFTKLKKGEMKDVTWSNALLIIDALGMKPSEFYELSVSADK